jgi:hypothetical protein
MADFDYILPVDGDDALYEFSVEEEGRVAVMCGCKLKHNPYPEESGLWQRWNDGYFSECPRRGESEEDRELREMCYESYIAEIKRDGTWEYLRPATPEERAEWAKDPNPPMETGLRRWKAKQQQKQR